MKNFKNQLNAVSKRQTLHIRIEREKKLYFLYVLNTSGHTMYGFYPTPTNSATAASCPKIQFNSDSMYLEFASDATD